MISVTNSFKTAVKSPTKEIRVYLTDQAATSTTLTESDDLVSLSLEEESGLLHTVMRKATVKHLGGYDFLGKYVNIGFGVVLASGVEYVDFGSFRVVERKIEKGSDIVSLKLFDKMYESLIDWDLDPVYDRSYPCTLLELLQSICTRLGWTLKTTTFPNHNTQINGDKWTGVVKTYREVLEMIAEVSGSIIYFDVDNQLVVKPISKTTPLETLNPDLLITLEISEKFGPINSVVLSRQPQEDNIVQKDDTSIASHGLTEIKIKNNLISDENRTTWITGIFTALQDLYFSPFRATTTGLGYFQIGDRITLEDPSGNTYETVILGKHLEFSGGMSEVLSCERPEKTNTNYSTAGVIGQTMRRTELIVDKQKGEISLLAGQLGTTSSQFSLSLQNIAAQVQQALDMGDVNQDNIADLQTSVTQLQQSINGLEIAVSGVGGTNLLKNSVGLKGDSIAEWQEFDSNGNLLDSNNQAEIVQTTEIAAQSESGSALRLTRKFITQNVPTIQGETYTFFCRYKSNNNAALEFTGGIVTTIPASNTWTTFKYQYVASSTNTKIKISNVSSPTGSEIILTDLVFKLGDANGWVQAPNEVYGKNYRFDKDGFAITSPTNAFKSILDNTKLAVYDTSQNKIVLVVSRDQGKITRLTAQDEFVIRRYENDSKSIRIIPTDQGGMLVIND